MQEPPKQDPQPAPGDDPYSRLTPELKQFIGLEIDAYGKSMTAFKEVVDETVAGKPLTKATLDELEARYQKETPDIGKYVDIIMAIEKAELEKAIAAQEKAGPQPHESIIKFATEKARALLPEEVTDRIDIEGIGEKIATHITNEKRSALETEISDKISQDYYAALDAKKKEWDDAHPDIINGLKPERLNQAFKRDNLSPPAYQKDVTLSPDTQDIKALLTRMISQNRGIAVGEVHNMDDSYNLLAENMTTLKAAGVDTIYIETDQKNFDERYGDLSADQLRQLAKDGKYKRMRNGEEHSTYLQTPDEVAEIYNTKYADDTSRAHVNMLAAAREHNIRLVPMDSEHHMPTAHGDLRVPTSNVVWMENIEADRRQLAEQGQGDGKFVVLGGMGHFINGHNGVKGLTDESLGVPALILAKGDPNTEPGFKKGTSPNGSDFYVFGGTDYHDSEKIVKAADMSQTADMLSSMASVPIVGTGMGMASATLKMLAGKYHKEAEDETSLPVENVTELPDTPPSLPAKQTPPEKTR